MADVEFELMTFQQHNSSSSQQATALLDQERHSLVGK